MAMAWRPPLFSKLMRSSLLAPALLACWASALPLAAQVPQLLHYQGRARVSGADFTGTGQFKFALLSANGATTYWSNDGTSAGGSAPAAAVSLGVQGGLYSIMLGDATRPGMSPLPAGLFSHGDVHLRVWFSDGLNGWQQLSPDQRLAAVAYALMADQVRDGAISTAQLAPGAVTASKIAPGSVSAAALAPTAVADSLAASGQGTVPPGAALVSLQADAPALRDAGYVPAGTLQSGDTWTAIAGGSARDRAASVWTGSEMLIWGDGAEGWRYRPATNAWTPMNAEGQPANRENPLAIWTGTEMIVWGGRSAGAYPNSGGRYNPSTDRWTAMSLTNAPVGRFNATAVWTGAELLLFGGNNGSSVLGDGARYHPGLGVGGTWTALPAAAAPAPRHLHSAIWTGSEMLVYGGTNGLAAFSDCLRFNPLGAGTWTAAAPSVNPRFYHTAVWTGSEMLAWGGTIPGASSAYNSGASYSPSTKSWKDLAAAGAPEGRIQHSAVWTGSEMIVWGGSTSATSLAYSGSGARYNPTNSTWTSLTASGAPAARVLPNMEWTGSEMIVWGGSNGVGFSAGGRYRVGQTFYLYQRP